jgi:membrane associated rhomboid family serine protease
MPIRLTQSVKFLLIASFACFLIQQTGDQFLGTHLFRILALIPADWAEKFYIWQIFTYAFVHSGVGHLFFNLLMIAFIGSELESLWGSKRFLQYYFACSIGSGLIYLLIQLVFLKGGGIYNPMVGASGAIYGLLLAFGILFGDRVLLFMMLFPMKAKHFIWVLVAFELLTTVYASGGSWAGLAQLGGMAVGFGVLWGRTALSMRKKAFDQYRAKPSRPKKRRSKHLKLIVNNDQDLDSLDQETERDPKTWH